MNIVVCPHYIPAGEVESVPGARQVPCKLCKATLTATPTSLDAVDAEGGFVCAPCMAVLTVIAPTPLPITRPKGASEELRSAGLGHIARSDDQLTRRLQGWSDAN